MTISILELKAKLNGKILLLRFFFVGYSKIVVCSVVDKDNGIFFSIRICTVLNANKAKIYLLGKLYEAIILI